MGKKATKATKKFAAKGQLKKQIQTRHKHQQIKKKLHGRKAGKKDNVTASDGEEDDEDDEVVPVKKGKSIGKGMTVDDFLGGGFMDGADSEDEGQEGEEQLSEEGDDDETDFPDDQSFASVDELDDAGQAHHLELSKLAEKDPEFYKYLQENDQELLDFDPTAVGEDEDFDDVGMDEDGEEDAMQGIQDQTVPVLMKEELMKWQKALLEQRSLRALRKLLIAFRSAAHMNEDDQELAWRIDSSSVYNKLVTTALKYTPMVLSHHVPYKTLPSGKFKPPTATQKLQTLQKLIQSYFHNILHILDQLTDTEMIKLAVEESAKIVPWVLGSRRVVKLYLKKCLELWAGADDSVRIAAFLAIRKLASAADESIVDQVLKGMYLTLIRSSKSTSIHSLPSINLMKNSASEIFCLDEVTAYQHAFGYIRQLAIHLRGSMKVKTKEAYRQVYNWQYVHCVDFWAIVLARACDAQVEAESGGKKSELRPLIYPLVQVSLGAIKLISNARSYPFHLHIVRSLLHLTRHTQIYIPIPPYILPILTSTLSPSTRPKPSTLKPLDFEVLIRAPQQYQRTRIYGEGLVEETAYLLAEWLASPCIHGSVAFPEIVVGVVVTLRRSIKASKTAVGGSGKQVGVVKALAERIEESAKWVEVKRKGVAFGPGKAEFVEAWQTEMRGKVEESPLGKYLKVLRKGREKRRALIEKARDGEDEILEE